MNINRLFPPKFFRKFFLAGIFEFGPVLLFIIAFERFHIYKATIILMVTTIISTIVTYSIQKRLPYLALYVALLTGIFGYITLTLHQPKFIQMRDTLYDATCAITLIIGLMINISFLKLAFHKVMPMTQRGWERLTYAWIGYFIIAAIANEYVRRTMTLGQWFDFKSVVIIVTSIFGILALYFLYEKED
jgi:intracellular septation protein